MVLRAWLDFNRCLAVKHWHRGVMTFLLLTLLMWVDLVVHNLYCCICCLVLSFLSFDWNLIYLDKDALSKQRGNKEATTVLKNSYVHWLFAYAQIFPISSATPLDSYSFSIWALVFACFPPLGNQISAAILHSGINIKSLLFTDVCCKSCHSVFPSDFTPIHYSFLPLFTQQNFRENCLSYKNIRAFQEVWHIQSPQ